MYLRTSRRLAGSLVATATLALLAGFISPAHAADGGLFGKSDPTYDGVFRQSLSIVALVAVDRRVPAAAEKWLVEQQCPNGGFQGYRNDTNATCARFSETTFTGLETNSTALAAIAMTALGRPARAAKAVRWLQTAQNVDGGMPLAKGGKSDAMSTALTLLAVKAVGPSAPDFRRSGKNLLGYLRKSMLVCNAPAAAQGAFSFQITDPLTADDMTTSQVVAALSGSLTRRVPQLASGDLRFQCPARVTANPESLLRASAAYVAKRLKSNEHRLPSAWGGGTDWTSTAWSVLGLVGTGHSAETVNKTVATLKQNAAAAITSPYSGEVEPGRLALMLLVSASVDQSGRNFGGVDLVDELLGTLR